MMKRTKNRLWTFMRPVEWNKLVQVSEEAAAFIKTTFKSKLKNADRISRAKKYSVSDSQWSVAEMPQVRSSN